MTAQLAPAERERFTFIDTGSDQASFEEDVRIGLTSRPKAIPPRWFYDALGSALFEAICQLPEYYVTRAETEILQTHAHEIAAAFGGSIRLIELGSGSARKTRLLLDAILARQPDLEYVPLDVDPTMLEKSGRELLIVYPSLRVTAVRGDFSHPSVPLDGLLGGPLRNVVLFLGSTIGNLAPATATSMLQDLRTALKPGDILFLGADRKKSRDVLIPAYDDALHVTQAFNANLLGRINRELGGHFDADAFAHEARYDEAHGRIEMHLVSQVAQRVRIDALDLDVDFAAGESIHTENSYKHDDATLAALASETGFSIERMWSDERGFFSDVLMLAR